MKTKIKSKMATSPTQSQNLISQISMDELRRPPGFWAALILDAVTVIMAGFSGYFYKNYLDGGSLIWPLVVFGVFCIGLFFGALLEKNFVRRLFVAFLSAGFMIAAIEFFSPLAENAFLPSWEILGASFAVFGVCLLWGEIVVKRDIENSLNIRFFKLSGSAFGKIMTGTAFAAIVLYIPYWNVEDMFFSRGAFLNVFEMTAGFANNFYPEVDFNAPIGDMAQSLGEVQFKKNPAYANLPPAARGDALQQFTDRFIKDISESAGIEINPDETLGTASYDYLINFFIKWQNQLQGVFLAIWAVSLFFLLKAAGALFAALLEFLAFFLYHTMLTVGIAHITHENVRKESLEFTN